ncbi:hypothetical protein BU15DRAFT_66898 [Melanogaster broomeanus]|nr:hypothetical protein BU15DRAFT_66898 [Melanogaster broomeanus]
MYSRAPRRFRHLVVLSVIRSFAKITKIRQPSLERPNTTKPSKSTVQPSLFSFATRQSTAADLHNFISTPPPPHHTTHLPPPPLPPTLYLNHILQGWRGTLGASSDEALGAWCPRQLIRGLVPLRATSVHLHLSGSRSHPQRHIWSILYRGVGLGAPQLHFNWLGAFESDLVPTYLKDQLGPFDTHVITTYKDYVITSPNANFIPKPYLFEEVVMRPLRDGRLVAQLYCNTYKWTGYIPREESYVMTPFGNGAGGILLRAARLPPRSWILLQIYVDLQERIQVLKLRQPSYTGPLKVDAWMRTVERTLQRLKDLPLMFRDLVIVVATFQRLPLDVFGMLHYLDRFSSNPPGLLPHNEHATCSHNNNNNSTYTPHHVSIISPDERLVPTGLHQSFSGLVLGFYRSGNRTLKTLFVTPSKNGWVYLRPSQRFAKKLYNVCTPVWFIRHQSLVAGQMNIHKVVSLTPPTNIICASERFTIGQGPAFGLPQLSDGAVEARQSSSVSGSAGGTENVHRNDDPPPGSQKGKGAVQKPVYSNVELWREPEHPAALPYIYNWKTALAAMDKNMKRVHPNAPKLAYYFPTPALFLRLTSSDRRMRYLTNWLPIRSAWISRLSVSDPTPVISRCWRDFLNDVPENLTATTYSSSLKKEAAELFSPQFSAIRHEELGPTVGFHDMSLPFVNLANIDDVLQIFPGDGGQTMCSIPFPITNEGLASSELGEKRHYVEKLRLLTSSWPDFPADIADILLPSSTLDDVCIHVYLFLVNCIVLSPLLIHPGIKGSHRTEQSPGGDLVLRTGKPRLGVFGHSPEFGALGLYSGRNQETLAMSFRHPSARRRSRPSSVAGANPTLPPTASQSFIVTQDSVKPL